MAKKKKDNPILNAKAATINKRFTLRARKQWEAAIMEEVRRYEEKEIVISQDDLINNFILVTIYELKSMTEKGKVLPEELHKMISDFIGKAFKKHFRSIKRTEPPMYKVEVYIKDTDENGKEYLKPEVLLGTTMSFHKKGYLAEHEEQNLKKQQRDRKKAVERDNIIEGEIKQCRNLIEQPEINEYTKEDSNAQQ